MADVDAGSGGMTSSDVQQLRAQINGLVGQVAKLEALCEQTAKGVERGHMERQNLWVEIRGYGEKLIQVTNEAKNISSGLTKLETKVDRVEAKVDSHDDTFQRAEGAGKFAIAVSKVLWAIGGGGVVAALGTLIALLTRGAPPPTGP